MRSILIDPVTQTVTEAEFQGNYREISKLLSDPEHGLNCNLFTVVRISEHEAIFVDDEGLLNSPQFFFVWKGYAQPLAGRGLILGDDGYGESIASKLTLDEVKANVAFTKLSVDGWYTTEGQTTVFDQPGFFVRTVPVFGPPKESEDDNERKPTPQ